ncbi:MAG: hypothetical protein GXO00_02075 [Candidatus Diapherotrites archaeon]|nr:hypothetical protein [Candidatus Diapherotrites archaeon]
MRWVALRLPLKEVEKQRPRRVAVWGVVVRKFVGEKHVMLLLDDFSAVMPVLLFEELRELEVDEGDVLRVIGLVKERNGEPRIVAEIVKKISGPEELVQRLENLLTLLGRRPPEVKEEEVEVVDLL